MKEALLFGQLVLPGNAEIGGVPIGLAHHLTLTHDVPAGAAYPGMLVITPIQIFARKKMQAS